MGQPLSHLYKINIWKKAERLEAENELAKIDSKFIRIMWYQWLMVVKLVLLYSSNVPHPIFFVPFPSFLFSFFTSFDSIRSIHNLRGSAIYLKKKKKTTHAQTHLSDRRGKELANEIASDRDIEWEIDWKVDDAQSIVHLSIRP